ncbi:hypothetical protein BCAR13_850020 [Paraburkholderia caribensis]|nr:hypothetical protein BCAR13_850020 [Paraburkholderia caribensis]
MTMVPIPMPPPTRRPPPPLRSSTFSLSASSSRRMVVSSGCLAQLRVDMTVIVSSLHARFRAAGVSLATLYDGGCAAWSVQERLLLRYGFSRAATCVHGRSRRDGVAR